MRKNILLFVSLFTMSMLIISCGSDDDQAETEIVAEETDDNDEDEETDEENEETEPSQVLITSFEMDIDDEETNVSGLVDNDSKTVVLQLPPGISTTFSPEITLSEENATISPASGDELDFTEPVTYIVTTEDGTETVYEVSVQVAEQDTSGGQIVMSPVALTTFYTSGSEDFEIVNPANKNIDFYLIINKEFQGYFNEEIVTEYISVGITSNNISWTNKLPLGENQITLGAYLPDTHTFFESKYPIVNRFEDGVFQGNRNYISYNYIFKQNGEVDIIPNYGGGTEVTGTYKISEYNNITLFVKDNDDDLIFSGKIMNPDSELPYIEGEWKSQSNDDLGSMKITMVEEE